jgi:hypothetical protein
MLAGLIGFCDFTCGFGKHIIFVIACIVLHLRLHLNLFIVSVVVIG